MENNIIPSKLQNKTAEGKDVEKLLYDVVEYVENNPVGTRIDINVESEDGETTYGVEKVSALDDEHIVAGMLGNGTASAFNLASSFSGEVRETVVEYLLSDLYDAVGEDYTITVLS